MERRVRWRSRKLEESVCLVDEISVYVCVCVRESKL